MTHKHLCDCQVCMEGVSWYAALLWSNVGSHLFSYMYYSFYYGVCMFVLAGSTYIACDWDQEVKEQCYNEEKSKVHMHAV